MGISCNQLRFRRWPSCDPSGYCEIATSAYGLLAMTNLRALCGRRCQPITYQPAWRSLTAATDAIGFYVFIDSRYKSAVQRRERHAAPLQRTAGGLCIFHSSFFSLQDSFPCAPPLQRTNGNFPRSILVFPLPSRSSSTHNITNIFVLWKKHKNPRGNPKRSLIIPSWRDLTNAGKCDKIKAQRESGAFKNTDPVFGIARQDRFVADRLGTPAFAAGAPFFFRRGREENQNV